MKIKCHILVIIILYLWVLSDAMSNVFATLVFGEKAGDYYTLWFKWTGWDYINQILKEGLGAGYLSPNLSEELITELMLCGYIPQFLPSGAEFDTITGSTYTLTEDIFFDHCEIYPMMIPQFVNYLSVLDFRRKYTIKAKLVYKNASAAWQEPPDPPPNNQIFAPGSGESGGGGANGMWPPGDIIYSPPSDYTATWRRVMQRNEIYNYTFLYVEFAKYMEPNSENNILYTWDQLWDDPPFHEFALNDYTGIFEMVPADFEWEWDIDEDYYGPYAKVLISLPTFPDQWWPKHDVEGGGGGGGVPGGEGDGDDGGGGIGGNLPPLPDESDPINELIGVGKIYTATAPNPAYEELQINGLKCLVNGLPVSFPNGT